MVQLGVSYGKRERINLIASLSILSRVGHFGQQSGIGSFRVRRNQESEKLEELNKTDFFFLNI